MTLTSAAFKVASASCTLCQTNANSGANLMLLASVKEEGDCSLMTNDQKFRCRLQLLVWLHPVRLPGVSSVPILTHPHSTQVWRIGAVFLG
jgi:hypothetical protein